MVLRENNDVPVVAAFMLSLTTMLSLVTVVFSCGRYFDSRFGMLFVGHFLLSSGPSRLMQSRLYNLFCGCWMRRWDVLKNGRRL